MDLQQFPYGSLDDGRRADQFILSNSQGLTVQMTNYGGILIAVQMPDKRDQVDNICLGFDDFSRYLAGHPYFGALVGRFANRIANGTFTLARRKVRLACNERGVCHLHGGSEGFDRKLWDADPFMSSAEAGVKLFYRSPDGEEGYPGNLDTTVIYSLNEANELTLDYTATCDWPTPVNLTNHAYWNLAGAGSETVHDHELLLNCPSYLLVDQDLIPTGQIGSVFNTALDFTTPKRIGQDIAAVGGFDHCFVIARPHAGLVQAARVWEPISGRGLEVWTTMPGVQLYTGNFLDNLRGAGGAIYRQQSALCLETEHFPDAVNQKKFPSAILYPGKTYHQVTRFKFFIN